MQVITFDNDALTRGHQDHPTLPPWVGKGVVTGTRLSISLTPLRYRTLTTIQSLCFFRSSYLHLLDKHLNSLRSVLLDSLMFSKLMPWRSSFHITLKFPLAVPPSFLTFVLSTSENLERTENITPIFCNNTWLTFSSLAERFWFTLTTNDEVYSKVALLSRIYNWLRQQKDAGHSCHHTVL